MIKTIISSCPRSKKLILLFVGLLAFSSLFAGKEFGLTGYDLLELCESGKDADKAICAYYVAGVSGGVSQANNDSGQEAIYCLPIGIRLPQLVKLFVGYADKKPELLEYPADSFVYVMLKSYFPCRAVSE